MRISYKATVLFVLGLAYFCVSETCTVTQANCFPPPVNNAPQAAAIASCTCGLSDQFGVETFSFGGITNRPEFARVDGLVCDASDPIDLHNVSDLNDEDSATWWQASHNDRSVTLRLDFSNPINLQHIEIVHRSVRPSRAQLEYSTANGATWSIYQFYAFQCGSRVSDFGGFEPRPRLVSLTELPQNSTEVDVFQTIKTMRMQRMGCVNTTVSVSRRRV